MVIEVIAVLVTVAPAVVTSALSSAALAFSSPEVTWVDVALRVVQVVPAWLFSPMKLRTPALLAKVSPAPALVGIARVKLGYADAPGARSGIAEGGHSMTLAAVPVPHAPRRGEYRAHVGGAVHLRRERVPHLHVVGVDQAGVGHRQGVADLSPPRTVSFFGCGAAAPSMVGTALLRVTIGAASW